MSAMIRDSIYIYIESSFPGEGELSSSCFAGPETVAVRGYMVDFI
jgi:hypothetical protein